jgi:hypothetical protein
MVGKIALKTLACTLFLFTLLMAGVARAEKITASDLSVLWPLKASADKDPVFMKTGDGFCNAMSLSDGSIFPQKSFERFAEIAFNSSQNECRRDAGLEDQFFFVPNEEVLRQDIHLALVKGLAPTACNFGAWKVTGLRFDPCRPSRARDNSSPAQCNDVLRLVAQPFEKQTNGLWAVRDFTIHLVYLIKDLPAFMADLKKTASIARQVEAAEPWEPEWDAKSHVLRPHHALRNELNTCNAPFSSALKNFTKKWAVQSSLIMVAWMTSSMGVKEWTFGQVSVSGNGDLFEASKISDRKFSNFSDSLLQAGKTATSAGVTNPSDANLARQLAIAGMPELPPSQNSVSIRTAHIDAVQKVLNPTKTSQSQIDCVACHLAPQILDRIRALYKTPAAVGSGEFKASIWPGFQREPRSFSQLRNFGYGPQFHIAVNRRTINETEDVFNIISQGLVK